MEYKELEKTLLSGKGRCVLRGGPMYLKLLLEEYGDMPIAEVARLELNDEIESTKTTKKKFAKIAKKKLRS